MPDVRCDSLMMEQLFGLPTNYNLHQMITGGVMTELDGRRGMMEVDLDDDLWREIGDTLERIVRDAMAGDGVVK